MGNCSLPAINHWGVNTRWWSYRFVETKRTAGLFYKYTLLTDLFYFYAHYGFEYPRIKLNYKFNNQFAFHNRTLTNFLNRRSYVFDPFIDQYVAYTYRIKYRNLIMGHIWVFAFNNWTIICSHFMTEPSYWLLTEPQVKRKLKYKRNKLNLPLNNFNVSNFYLF